MKIGIVGSEKVGQTLARSSADEGHDVHIGSREGSKLQAFAAQTGIKEKRFAEIAAFADVVVLAVKGDVAESLVREAFTNCSTRPNSLTFQFCGRGPHGQIRCAPGFVNNDWLHAFAVLRPRFATKAPLKFPGGCADSGAHLPPPPVPESIALRHPLNRLPTFFGTAASVPAAACG